MPVISKQSIFASFLLLQEISEIRKLYGERVYFCLLYFIVLEVSGLDDPVFWSSGKHSIQRSVP